MTSGRGRRKRKTVTCIKHSNCGLAKRRGKVSRKWSKIELKIHQKCDFCLKNHQKNEILTENSSNNFIKRFFIKNSLKL